MTEKTKLSRVKRRFKEVTIIYIITMIVMIIAVAFLVGSNMALRTEIKSLEAIKKPVMTIKYAE